MTANLLEVKHLDVDLVTRTGAVSLVHDVSLHVAPGESLGLVGESGSGKTMTSLAIMGLLPRACRVSGGSIVVDGHELVGAHRNFVSDMQGPVMGMVFQDAMRSLHPSFTVGEQIAEVARRHLGDNRKAAKARAVEMLGAVGIPNAKQRIDDYPHMFSGGMSQRVMIAMALVCHPKFLIADEPTTALDVTVQAQVLRLLSRLQREMELGILFITHDLGVVAEMCDRIAVLYGGEVVEQGDSTKLFESPQHPYTAGLLDAIPKVQQRGSSFGFIEGTVPSARNWPTGCRFHTRCPYVVPGRCDVESPRLQVTEGGIVRCVRADELELQGVGHPTVA